MIRGVKLKRYDMKKLLADPKFRRDMIIRSTISVNAMENIDVPYKIVAELYDKMVEEKKEDEKFNHEN